MNLYPKILSLFYLPVMRVYARVSKKETVLYWLIIWSLRDVTVKTQSPQKLTQVYSSPL